TFRDSGGPCEFVLHDETGVVLDPDSDALAEALHQLWEDQAKARAMGRNGKAHYQDLDLRWDRIVDALV
ncbi:MAG: glycosyltransferase, partial [Pseudomonadota bacterium]|nr:glycosyltransferase [Pseudomonadota bacterium]